MTLQEAEHVIDMAWLAKSAKMDWSGMELAMVNILNMNQPDNIKVLLMMDCINAFTKRGYFQCKPEDRE